ncbi:MAG: hypothetical protein Q8O94_02245, partial [bacterium]|nr:hypothetical protein [bacterium]
MRTLRAIGVIGSAAALLLSATVVFAQGQGVGASRAKANSEQTTIATSTQKEKGETARERMQTLREAARTNTAAEREGVAARVAEMQDKAKQTMAQKLTSQFENINTVWTDHFMNLLDRYDAILQKIQARAT